MTGFGRGSISEPGMQITVDLKTVNNRFLDISLRLPGEMQELEAAIRRVLSSRLSRGRVDVSLQYDIETDISYELNRPLIKAYVDAMNEMQAEFSLSGEPDLNVIARLPNVLVPKKEDPDAAFLANVEKALSIAVDNLETMRESEGGMLAEELSARLVAIQKRLPAIEEAADSITEEYRQKLTKRITEMLAKSETQIEIDQSRMAQEIAYIADKADISEEITRLRTHIEHFRAIMTEKNDVGKRLDFLTQELNREANTIASKTANMVIKENALEIKSEIEKIREQVQNVE